MNLVRAILVRTPSTNLSPSGPGSNRKGHVPLATVTKLRPARLQCVGVVPCPSSLFRERKQRARSRTLRHPLGANVPRTPSSPGQGSQNQPAGVCPWPIPAPWVPVTRGGGKMRQLPPRHAEPTRTRHSKAKPRNLSASGQVSGISSQDAAAPQCRRLLLRDPSLGSG